MPKFLCGFLILFLLNVLYYQNTVVKLAEVDEFFRTAQGRGPSASMHPNSSRHSDGKALNHSIDPELLEIIFSSLRTQQANISDQPSKIDRHVPLEPAITHPSAAHSPPEPTTSVRTSSTTNTHRSSSSTTSEDFSRIRWEYTLPDGARFTLEQVPPELAVPAGRRYTALARRRWLNRTGSESPADPASESSVASGYRAPSDARNVTDLARIRRIWIWGASARPRAGALPPSPRSLPRAAALHQPLERYAAARRPRWS